MTFHQKRRSSFNSVELGMLQDMIIVMIISVNLSGYAADLVMKIWFGNIAFFVRARAFPWNFYFCSCWI